MLFQTAIDDNLQAQMIDTGDFKGHEPSCDALSMRTNSIAASDIEEYKEEKTAM